MREINMSVTKSNRILIIDDNVLIHEDFKKILCNNDASQNEMLSELSENLFGDEVKASPLIKVDFELTTATQGEEGLAKVKEAQAHNNPFAIAFVDGRMPPGWDGVETIKHLWECDDKLQIVFCTAFSDHSWESILQEFGLTDKLLILKKPFDSIEVLQLATSLAKKWELARYAEQAVTSLEDKLSTIMQNAPEFIFTLDKDFIVTYINRVKYHDMSEVLGKSIFDFFDPAAHELMRSTYHKVLETGEPQSFETSTSVPGGEVRWFNVRVGAQRSGDVINGLINFSADVTAEKKLEEQFRQSQKMEAIGRLAGGIAHDFNNLLTISMGHTSLMLAKKDLPPNQVENLQAIHEASERAAALTRQLLMFTRKHVTAPEPVKPNELIVGMRRMLERIIGENINLVTKLDPDVGYILVDKHQLEQVFMNLLVNARDAITKDGVISIETKSVMLDNKDAQNVPYVQLSVSDNGSGIPKEIQEKIFEPFFTTKPVGKGTGLGLSTVFGIVHQNKGQISLSSEVGRGTTFDVSFPLHEKIQTAAKEPLKNVPLGGNESILLVEDDKAVREIACTILIQAGHRVTVANNGEEALVAIENNKNLDLLVTDIVMPRMGGKELVDALEKKNIKLPVIFMSGYTEHAIFHQGLESINFIQKPFKPETLLGKVREVLSS